MIAEGKVLRYQTCGGISAGDESSAQKHDIVAQWPTSRNLGDSDGMLDRSFFHAIY